MSNQKQNVQAQKVSGAQGGQLGGGNQGGQGQGEQQQIPQGSSSNYSGVVYKEFPKNMLKVTLISAQIEDDLIPRKGKYGIYAIVKFGVNPAKRERVKKKGDQKASASGQGAEDGEGGEEQSAPQAQKQQQQPGTGKEEIKVNPDEVFENAKQLEKNIQGRNVPQYTKIDKEHGRDPEWNQAFEFERTTEQKVHIIFKEREIEPQLPNRVFYSWNKKSQNPDSDPTIGVCKIDFSKALLKPGEKIVKEGIVTSPDQKEELGRVQVEFEYEPDPNNVQQQEPVVENSSPNGQQQQQQPIKKKKFFQIDDQEKKKAFTVTVSGCRADNAHVPEDPKEMQAYLKVRANGSSQSYKSADTAPAKNMQWSQETYKFDLTQEDKKLSFEVHCYNPHTMFDEVTGYGCLLLKDVEKKLEEDNKAESGEFTVELTYLGKQAGVLNVKLDMHATENYLKKKRQQMMQNSGNFNNSSINLNNNKISLEAQLLKLGIAQTATMTQNKKKIEQLEKRKQFFQQRLYENVKVQPPEDVDKSIDGGGSTMNGNNMRYSDIYELKVPANGENFPRCYKLPEEKEDGLKNVSQLLDSQIQPQEGKAPLVLPKIGGGEKSGQQQQQQSQSQVETKTIKVKRKWENIYASSIFGQGFSKNESATSLQGSVHSYSMPKGPRFEDFRSVPPGPGSYGSIGFLPKTETIDDILKNRRRLMYEDFVKNKPKPGQQ